MADNSNAIGSGSDTIQLTMAGDSAAGTDPQFTVNVDGQQIGSAQSVSASHGAQQTQTFTFQGNYAPGPHDVTVTYVNNFMLPEESGDRNLYVEGVSYNGQTVSGSETPLYESAVIQPVISQSTTGNATFQVNDTTAVPSDAPSTPSTTPGPVSIGSGADTLVLKMAETAYQGDAQFTIAVDGKQVGDTQTVTAEQAEGQQQEFDVHGDWGGGTHTVSVTYTNDKIGDFYAGTNLAIDTTDRNLFVMGASLNGGPSAGGLPWELDSNGSKEFTVTAGSGASSGSASGNTSSSETSGTSGTSAGSDTTASTTNDAATTTNGSSGSSASGSTGGSDTGNNAPITSDSLSTSGSGSDSSSGMSFLTSSNNSGTTSGSSDTSSGFDNSSATGLDDGNSSTALNSVPSWQDWKTPSWTGWSDASSSGTSGGSQWWMAHSGANQGTPTLLQNG